MKYFELLVEGKFDEVVESTIALAQSDGMAAEAFLRVFMIRDNMFLLSKSTVELIEKESAQGNAFAQYAYGRWHSIKVPSSDSSELSLRLFEQAYAAGLAEAGAALSIAYLFGDYGEVDLVRSQELLEEALAGGSLLAKWRKLRQLAYGTDDAKPQPAEALALAEKLIAQDEARGLPANGAWYFMRASAVEELVDRMSALPDYEKARDLGIIQAWFYTAYIRGYGNGDTLIDKDQYDMLLLQAADHSDAAAICAGALELIENFDEIVKNNLPKRDAVTQQIFSLLNKSATLGNTMAMIELGDIFREGKLGNKTDFELAHNCYAMAAVHDDCHGYERLVDMAYLDMIQLDEHTIAYYALKGTRCGSDLLRTVVVEAYKNGELQDYKNEIEKYYLSDADETEGETAAENKAENKGKAEDKAEVEELKSTPEALASYIKHCNEYRDRAKKILQEQGDTSVITPMVREVIRLAGHLGQFEHTLDAAYVATRDMADCVYEHPRLLLQLKQTELDILEYIEAVEQHDLRITDELRDEIAELEANIEAADAGRFADIKTESTLKSDPVEWTAEYEAVIDEAEHEAYSSLVDTPRGMGFCFAYWAEKRKALAKRGIEWSSPNILNPGVMFD